MYIIRISTKSSARATLFTYTTEPFFYVKESKIIYVHEPFLPLPPPILPMSRFGRTSRAKRTFITIIILDHYIRYKRLSFICIAVGSSIKAIFVQASTESIMYNTILPLYGHFYISIFLYKKVTMTFEKKKKKLKICLKKKLNSTTVLVTLYYSMQYITVSTLRRHIYIYIIYYMYMNA
ncbi:hypothetical protein AGLY_000736 [Aphis glycines]|uniref:Uncharacterized protein n=1 Tax=Aphis glycines TaxID=307491 RepID=A0A6G0U8C0_APHGL|nr:hypothetical protein AGLY_000736 [Aphis glycines]